ncbi:hypothetical protein [Paeniglutamicibacter terrestris]|uniref:Uncharacterized protein n=1 Tax=Paeniglutamicibacter terrestris TaxID=2723403 RepID=A0ABX1G6M9_9MICC|nr:hypothetical protein [Paeniglutamicibacter terrestris]NKG21077.1 hypothetical protein [Paeniglutamicibacter terrestris]
MSAPRNEDDRPKLVLTVYPLDMSFPIGYRLPRDTRVTLAHVNRWAREKHLGDAELAAEYQRARGLYEMECAAAFEAGVPEEIDPHVQWIKARLLAIHRFATLPHASEAGYE